MTRWIPAQTLMIVSLAAANLAAAGIQTGRARPDEDPLRKAIIFLEQGKTEKAEVPARQALELNPRDPVRHNVVGIIHERRGRVAEAEQANRTALRSDPGFAGARNNRGTCSSGKSDSRSPNRVRAATDLGPEPQGSTI